MFSRIGKHVSYTNVALTLALVFAMTGGAYAASKFVITSTKQIKPSVLKQLQKAGPAGKQGPAGPAGPGGPGGAPGAKGDNGASGNNGANAETTSFNGAKGACTAGGVEVKSATPAVNVCNGKEGKAGKDGSPWTAGGTLPKGSSERGQWVLAGKASGRRFTSLSFPVPLAAPLTLAKTHVIGPEEGTGGAKVSPAITNGECTGNSETPGATTENLCVFISPTVVGTPAVELADTESESFSAGISGAILGEVSPTEANYFYQGSWVVTG